MVTKIRYYISKDVNPYYNLALEEYLLYHCEEDMCILYLWQNANTVVIGQNQNAYRECNVTRLEQNGGHLARRLSGGGAVFHDLGNLNFTFLVRKNNYNLDKQMDVIIEALKDFGLHAERSGRNDLLLEEKKFSGNAYYESKGYAYHHGCIMVSANTQSLADYLNVSKEKLESKGVKSVKSRVANLSSFNSEITVEKLKESLIKAFNVVYSSISDAYLISEDDLKEIEALSEKYSSKEWLYGRKIKFSDEISHRFSFGEVQIRMDVNAGIIDNVQCYTDALDTSISEQVESLLKGKYYRSAELMELAKIDNPMLNEICVYIAKSV